MSEIDVIISDADYPAEFENTPEASAIKFIHVDVTWEKRLNEKAE